MKSGGTSACVKSITPEQIEIRPGALLSEKSLKFLDRQIKRSDPSPVCPCEQR